jgi:hypothetical protein
MLYAIPKCPKSNINLSDFGHRRLKKNNIKHLYANNYILWKHFG